MVMGILTPYRYLRRHTHFHPVQRSSRSAFAPDGTLPYHSRIAAGIREFGTTLSPDKSSVQRDSTSELLRTL